MGDRTILTTLIQQLLALDRRLLQKSVRSGNDSIRIEIPEAVAFARRFRDHIYGKIIQTTLRPDHTEKDKIPFILRQYYWDKYFIHFRNNEQHVREVWNVFLRLALITDRYLYHYGNEPKNYILDFTCTVIESYLNPEVYRDGMYLLQPSMARTHQIPRIQVENNLSQRIKLQINLLITMYKNEQIHKGNISELIMLARTLHQFRETIETIPYQGWPEFKIASALWECYFADFYPFIRTSNNTPIYDYIFLLYDALLKLRDTVALYAEPATTTTEESNTITQTLHTITLYEAACRRIEYYFISTHEVNLVLLPTATVLLFLAKAKVESVWFLNFPQFVPMLKALANPSKNYQSVPEVGPLATQFYLINIIAASGSKALTLIEQPQFRDLRKILCGNLGLLTSESIPKDIASNMTISEILKSENLGTLEQLMCNNFTHYNNPLH